MPWRVTQWKRILIPTCVIWLIGQVASGADYASQIKPLLQAKCYACHSAIKQEGDLRLETRELMVDVGQAVVPGDASSSPLWQRVQATDAERMPPPGDGAPLSQSELDLLRDWINDGALAPSEAVPMGPRDHWAFSRIERPPVPWNSGRENTGNDHSSRDHSGHQVDQFLQQHHTDHGLQVASPAPRAIALRRLYLDLIGLPPTNDQIADERPWEQIVDELLHDPRHGEHWARHWMDIWRYSDWYGLGDQLRYSQKHLWHWRDWIIESLNADKGYDQMVREMLAGDELAPTDPQVVRATGFLARNYYLFNRTTWLDSTIEHTCKAMLGLTVNCAKCHDHKYDPISQRDYYRLRAIFEPHQVRLDPVSGVIDLERDGLPRVYDDHLDALTYVHIRGDAADPDTSKPISPGVPEWFDANPLAAGPIDLPPSAYAPMLRPHIARDRLAAADGAIEQAEAKLQEVQEARDQFVAQLKIREAALASARTEGSSTDGGSTEGSSSSTEDDMTVEDSFDQPRPDLWELVGEHWRYEAGQLVQSSATQDSHYLRLRRQVPRDFQLTCDYTTLGGATYKSFSIRFDESDDQQYANFVYTSAHAPGPKVQIAMVRQGRSVYPPAARRAREIQVGKAYQLRIAVRDRLVNVWLDDEFQLAYQLPDRPAGGQVRIAGFDATIKVDHFKLTSLPSEQTLTSPDNGPPVSVESWDRELKIATARVAATRAARASLVATLEADKCQYSSCEADVSDEESDKPTDNKSNKPTNNKEAYKTAALAAARLQAAAALADAQLKQLETTDAKKMKAAADAVQAAQKRLAEAQSGSSAYASLRVSRKALETPEHNDSTYAATYPSQSTGRRLAFARWITHRDNPLAARVAVNHIWLRHFGQPLVESTFDFGLRTGRPVHADLLDFLACELIESGWSMRHLHRLLVTSDAYRRGSSSAGADRATLESDPSNQFYWRMNTRRMQSQMLRDSLLFLAGQLDSTTGGPSVKPGNDVRRRSVYFVHSRDSQDKFLAMFDDADLLQCYRRSESIVPQQALALSNSELALSMSGRIADHIIERHPEIDNASFVQAAFARLLCRQPEASEQRRCEEFMAQIAGLHSDKTPAERIERAGQRLVHALINHNDFISIR